MRERERGSKRQIEVEGHAKCISGSSHFRRTAQGTKEVSIMVVWRRARRLGVAIDIPYASIPKRAWAAKN